MRVGTCRRCGRPVQAGKRGPLPTWCPTCRQVSRVAPTVVTAAAPRRAPKRSGLCRWCLGPTGGGARVYCSTRCLKAYGRSTYPPDPAAVAARSSARRARIKGAAVGELVIPLVVFRRDRWRCGLCGRGIDPEAPHNSPGQPTIDHVLPLSRGGAHSYANVQAAHRQCNTEKGARDVAR